jgi:hypothetical protein
LKFSVVDSSLSRVDYQPNCANTAINSIAVRGFSTPTVGLLQCYDKKYQPIGRAAIGKTLAAIRKIAFIKAAVH